MRSYAEQFLLLSIDPVSGKLYPLPQQVMHLSLAGALLFDASFGSLINDDWEKLEVLKTAHETNKALSEALGCLSIFEESISINQAIQVVAAHGNTLNKLVWEAMQKEGMLSSKKTPILTGHGKQDSYQPKLSLVIDIQQEIRNTILSEELPDFQMPPLVSLIEAAGLSKYILKPEEIEQYQQRITWLASMESLGREIMRSVKALEKADLEKEVATLVGLKHDQPKAFAGGMDAVLTALNYLNKEAGINKSRKLIKNFNQLAGFECPGCAWPNPDKHRSRYEFCENGAKNVSAAATNKIITAEFFSKWSIKDLLLTPEYWLEQQGRLSVPMFRNENSTHYQPISWKDAYQLIAEELKKLDDPNQAVFYASGRTSNEAAFLYQLFARALGTNNLPNSANICHEPSGKALAMSLGFGKSSVDINDFPKANAIFLFGHNPGSNHPRMLSSLQTAVRKGCKIVAINPMPEASLMRFSNPQEAGSYFGKQTALAELYIQPNINGDMAFVRGIAKVLIEQEENEGGVLNRSFIEMHTSGYNEYLQQVKDTTWETIIEASGVTKDQILQAAKIYNHSENTIASWCLGITHHRNSIETIQEIINLLLLKGNIGKPGAGACPVRGHSNIQGIRTVGVGENMPATFLDNLESYFEMPVPRTPGMSMVPAIKSVAEGNTKVLLSLGGNLASALPDTKYVEDAIQKCELTVMISTKLNRSHLITGKKALILPAFSRLDEDLNLGKKESTTIEDAMCKISYSRGCLPPPSKNTKSEIAIVAEMAFAALGNPFKIDWDQLKGDYQIIREAIAYVVPSLNKLEKSDQIGKDFYYENPLKKGLFKTNDGKAHFSDHPLLKTKPEFDELLLMTIRSHDQFNTSVFGLNDRYRGINNERRVVFMNGKDMEKLNISPEQLVSITSNYDNRTRKLNGYYAIPYPIKEGCVATYFPEANVLTSINEVHPICNTPAYKSIRVKVRPN